MELLYLLGSLVWNSTISIILTLLIPIHMFISLLLPSNPSSGDGITLYEGVVWHERRRPVHHKFEYKVRYALIDLDCRPHLLSSSNHLSAHDSRKIAHTTGPV
ncbi:Cytochrome P450 4d8 [Bienertia sinuspersici]